MEPLLNKLKSLGYTDKQARVYLTLLSLGSGSVQSIALESGLKRPTVYVILDELIEKGTVSKAIGKRKKSFIPIQPEVLLGQIEKLYQQTKECIPELVSLMNQKKDTKTRTLYFEGLLGIEKALWYKIDELNNSSIFAFFGTTEYATQEMVKVFHRWNRELAQRKIDLKSISPKESSLREFRKKDQEYGFESMQVEKNKYSSKISIDITDKFVRILFFREKQALIIENEELSLSMKQIFSMIWK